MLMPLPATLRRLVTEYETLLAERTDPSGRRLRDLAYTLCVSTGTREITDALAVARSYLADPATTTALARPTATRRGAAESPASREAAPRSGDRPTTPLLASTGQGGGR
ncbi:DUF5133 domain-containing protein [Streptomyces sp. NPDC058751]|uniref:DUF5133 domain-containing protein n=1 Tax=Streptomyces sp. NPDC058751 TaxID=3346623 RepID=UPI003685C6A9